LSEHGEMGCECPVHAFCPSDGRSTVLETESGTWKANANGDGESVNGGEHVEESGSVDVGAR
jgi:hypothetical protein